MKCRYRDCKAPATDDKFCEIHRPLIMAIIRKHIEIEADVEFIYGHFDGCTSKELADFLGVPSDILDEVLLGPVDSVREGWPGYRYGCELLVRAIKWRSRIKSIYAKRDPVKFKGKYAPDEPIPIFEASIMMDFSARFLFALAEKPYPFKIKALIIDDKGLHSTTTLVDMIQFARDWLSGRNTKQLTAPRRRKLENFLKKYAPEFSDMNRL